MGRVEALGVLHKGIRGRSFRNPLVLKSILELRRYLVRHNIKVVQTYGYYSNVPGVLAAYLAGVPVIVASRRETGDLRSGVRRQLEGSLLQLADRIVVNATPIKEALVRAGTAKEKVVVIHNGVEVRFSPEAPNAGLDIEPCVGMVANFGYPKDHLTFLDGAELVLRSFPSARFMLVGSGPEEESVKQYALDRRLGRRVKFCGRVVEPELSNIVNDFSVAVLCSLSEGLPNVLLEAMAAGKPVVATDVGGVGDAVKDGVTGFLVAPKDPRKLADRIVWLLRNPREALAMGMRGRKRVERHFALTRMHLEFQDLYAEVLREKEIAFE